MVAIILIIAAIAIPNLMRSRMLANQAAAVSTLRNLNNSQASYIADSVRGYADNFVKLGPGLPCDATHACLVDDLIGCASQPCIKSGYGYFMVSTSTAAPFVDYAFNRDRNRFWHLWTGKLLQYGRRRPAESGYAFRQSRGGRPNRLHGHDQVCCF